MHLGRFLLFSQKVAQVTLKSKPDRCTKIPAFTHATDYLSANQNLLWQRTRKADAAGEIVHLFLQSVSNQFHVIISSLPM